MAQSVKYMNERGQESVIGNTGPIILQKITGLGYVESEVISQKAPYQDGSTRVNTTLSSRNITMTIIIQEGSVRKAQETKAYLSRVFNPKLGGKLIYSNDYHEKEIQCISENGIELIEDSGSMITLFISLLADNPFWLDTYVSGESMADWIGGMSFPFSFPISYATRSTRTDTLAINSGDVETPIYIEFIGNAVNPKLINVDTGEFIKVNKTIKSNEKLVINTEFGNKEVALVNLDSGEKQNAFGYLDQESDFFDLEVGDNKLNFSADSGNPKVYVKWQNRYMGV